MCASRTSPIDMNRPLDQCSKHHHQHDAKPNGNHEPSQTPHDHLSKRESSGSSLCESHVIVSAFPAECRLAQSAALACNQRVTSIRAHSAWRRVGGTIRIRSVT